MIDKLSSTKGKLRVQNLLYIHFFKNTSLKWPKKEISLYMYKNWTKY